MRGQIGSRAHPPCAAVNDEHAGKRPGAVRPIDVGRQRPRISLDEDLIAQHIDRRLRGLANAGQPEQQCAA